MARAYTFPVSPLLHPRLLDNPLLLVLTHNALLLDLTHVEPLALSFNQPSRFVSFKPSRTELLISRANYRPALGQLSHSSLGVGEYLIGPVGSFKLWGCEHE